MRILPTADFKRLSECEPGDLIIIDVGSEHTPAFVAQAEDNNGKVLIFLRPVSGQRAPSFGTMAGHFNVLSYGKDYRIEIDHSSLVELRPRRFYEANGAACLVGSEWQIHVLPSPGSRSHWAMHYRFSSGHLLSTPDINTFAVFTRWSIQIPEQSTTGRPAPFLVFDIHPQS